MWLGVFAIIVAVSFALIKFLTSVHIRHLRERRLRLHNELTKSKQRFTALEGRREIEKSKNGAIKQKLKVASNFKDDMYQRLLIELPDRLQGDLRACINRNPIPEPRGIKLFHQLKLPEKITDALGAVSVAVVQFLADDESAAAVLKGELIHALDKDGISCAFDTPQVGLDLVRGVGDKVKGNRAGQLRGALTSGAGSVADPGQDDADDVSRLFARALEHTQQLAETAPEATLLLNEAAYEGVKKKHRGELELFSKSDKLYAFTWSDQSAEGEGEGETDTAPVADEAPTQKDAGAEETGTAPSDEAEQKTPKVDVQ